ncbi:MAG: DUF4926 domain-containing protein [Patulibacter sp.]|nr:DUF4926 domain-containing protein [Patulibacter sp.]
MASVEHMISEHDVVTLRSRVGRWSAGSRGTVVQDYGRSKLIEFADEHGATLELVTVRGDQLERCPVLPN